METRTNNFVITKRIAKHGKQAVVVVPKLLEDRLRPGVVVQVTFNILGGENEK